MGELSEGRHLAFSADGTMQAITSADALKVLHTETSSILLETDQSGYFNIQCAVFSPDGSWLVTGSSSRADESDSTLQCYPIRGNSAPVLLHVDSVDDLAISPDGTRLATVGEEVRLWDTASGMVVAAFEGSRQVEFSPDGYRLAYFGLNGSVRVADARRGIEEADDVRQKVAVEYEARSLVDFVAQRSHDMTHAKELVSRNRETSKEVWQSALDMLDIVYQGRIVTEASDLVEELLGTPHLKSEVEAMIRADDSLSAAVRDYALVYSDN